MVPKKEIKNRVRKEGLKEGFKEGFKEGLKKGPRIWLANSDSGPLLDLQGNSQPKFP